ncbi:uncharacterized protein I303_105402 [Kwoniella dejecticola CBS 10117]|uniref:Mus7/MMS22 family-domain-containing protein n=1 Tax=Kwoniella dejecticola CBS 10117 TaxID=1296121 RepID=A0A1A6A2L2_9TREE|nr:uncharacterized protein I303_05152 [Kwoniella dejecticola CBS 10117]OBR84295.1 hypothetical protein I303_05152 [Kwoniella dejecticola CBS 10117]
MPPRAGPSADNGRSRTSRPAFIPSTQFAATSSPRSAREESEDPLALSPIKILVTPTAARKNRTRRGTRSSNIRSSSPFRPYSDLPSSASTQRVTRGSKRREREVEELAEDDEDLVPPSDEDEYEEWRESRRIRLDKGKGKGREVDRGRAEERKEVGPERDKEGGRVKENEKRNEVGLADLELGLEADLGRNEEKGMRRPRKPDKGTFHSLLPSPSPPSPTPSTSSSVTDTRSRETSPTQPLSFSQQDDPFYLLHDGERYTPDISTESEIHNGAIGPREIPVQGSAKRNVANSEEVDRSRSLTPQTIPLSPVKDQAYETVMPDPIIIESASIDSPHIDTASLLLPQQPADRSPTPKTVPFLPLHEEAYETMLPEVTLEIDAGLGGSPLSPVPAYDVFERSDQALSSEGKASQDQRPSAMPVEGDSAILRTSQLLEDRMVSSRQPDTILHSSPARSLSQMFAEVTGPTDIQIAVVPDLPTPSPVDPALQQFRGARTFRTRTVLQLQPYTKEKQIYEAALRKGGLKKGKKAIAPSKEITQEEDQDDDEAQVSDSSEASAAEESPDRIVIGNTPPPKKTRKPKVLIDADHDEFLFEHGVAADEENPDHFEALQKIARQRLKAEKEEKRRLLEAVKQRKQFESLMRAMQVEEDHSDEDRPRSHTASKSRTIKERPAGRTPNGTKTYGSRPKGPKIISASSSESDDNALPAATIRPMSPSDSPRDTQTASYRTAFSGFNDIDMDVGYGQPHEPSYSDHNAGDAPTFSLAHENSFYVDDSARPPDPARSPADSESASSSSETETVQDRRKKIAGRMLPAAMLKKLEAEAAAKERRREEKKKRHHRAIESPIRPGRAIVRRGAGHGELEDLDELFEEKDPDVTAEGIPTLSYDPSPPNSFGQPIIVPDSESSSEAEEDNQTEQTLARLQRGDFESIVSGKRWTESGAKRNNHAARQKSRMNRFRRPALEFERRIRAPISENNRAMVQSRLDFPVMDRSPNQSVKKKRKRPMHQGRQQRPAIRLDDHVIFATAEFEFDDEDEDPPRPISKQKTIPRHFARTPSANLKQGKSLDANMGKARSWANFDKFPIDYDISPLPSGVYCSATLVAGSGQLARLVADLRGEEQDGALTSCFEHGIELKQDMSPDAVHAVIPLLFDATFRQMVTIVNEDNSDGLLLRCFAFLADYMHLQRHSIDESVSMLRSEAENAIRRLDIKFKDIDIGRNKQGREALLKLRWAMLEMSCQIQNHRKIPEDSLVRLCAVKILHQLLSQGFDKTIRPLKQIMRGESESAEINDISLSTWIALINTLKAWDDAHPDMPGDLFMTCLNEAFDTASQHDRTGPIAAERIWFLIFGLCALTQFDTDGKINSMFLTSPRWALVRRAASLIKVAFDEDAEKRAHLDQLQGRDRYIKVMMARCIRLSAVWKWSFDRESFSVATKDLGIIFKDRQYRNLPTEPPVDYPDFIIRFDMSLTAAEDTKRETAFELYLRLVCVAASDIISAAQTLTEAQQAEKDVQRLVMSIIPVSAVKFNRIFPPSPKDLGQLINRYSTMIAGCYFSPSLLPYLLANSKSWSSFENADFDSRQIVIRGLMYLCVAARHHDQPLEPIIDRLNDLMKVLQAELEYLVGPSASVNQSLNNGPSRLEIERTMVLIVSCFKRMIKHHSFDVEMQQKAVYPDPSLLHESWTTRIFDLELSKDLKCGLEVIATIQTFLDTRASALPKLAKQRREAKESNNESFDEFGSLGIDFADADVLALGGDLGEGENEVEKKDEKFAGIIENVISPKIYRLLSDMLPPVSEHEDGKKDKQMDRQLFISKLTKCWSDCAAVLVVEHQKLDWSTFISPFGRQSWARLGDEKGRVQVGLHFMLNVAQLDPAAFAHYAEDFISLFFQTVGTDMLTIEHKFTSAMITMRGALDHPLLAPLSRIEAFERELSRDGFMGIRVEALQAIFATLPDILKSSTTPASTKSFTYRCINLFVSSLTSYEKGINPTKVIHKESYRAFTDTIIRDLRRIAGDWITPLSVPGLKHFKG